MCRLENEQLGVTFLLEENGFKIKQIYNKILHNSVKNLSENDFSVLLCNGKEIFSTQMQKEILQTDEKIVAIFKTAELSMQVKYFLDDKVLRKEITVLSSNEKINYINGMLWQFSDAENVFQTKHQKDIAEMANFPGYYVEMGQPIYAKGLFAGMEFPMAENRVIQNKSFVRYYLGQTVEAPKKLWDIVVGAGYSLQKSGIRKGFFEYLTTIAQPAYFRKQYNSWYDHMLDITEENILESFKQINKGFKSHGIQLDAFVVDDGWTDYRSFWQFNKKFPNALYKVKEEVEEMGSSLGLWVGPRGGYCGTEVIMSNWLEENPQLNLGSKNKRSNDVNVGDFRYLKALGEKMLDYQKKFNITYWKIDGLLLRPDQEDESGEYSMHIMTRVYENLIDIFTRLRQESGNPRYWLNLTSYVNPSPWFLRWVNSLWIQTSSDVGYSQIGETPMQKMMTYRDGKYCEFLRDREIELPLWSLYNHEPIYAETANRGWLEEKIYATSEEFYDYLRFIATRGNGFWEFYYSYSMFDEERWNANAKAVKWIEKNYDILKNSEFFGGRPERGEVYGYTCKCEKGSITSYRNPSGKEQSYNGLNLKPYEIKIVEE